MHKITRAERQIQHCIFTAHQALDASIRALWRRGGSKPQRIGLAISGGVDSMALAFLCREMRSQQTTLTPELDDHWTDEPPKTDFTAFIVDHRLREGSSEEAANVAGELQRLGLESRILKLPSESFDRPGQSASLPNMESVARKLRFQALGKACREQGINHLMLAHHSDDQAETVLMRMISGYLGDGLRGVQAEAALPESRGVYGVDHSGQPLEREIRGPTDMLIESGGVTIMRPLLGVAKAEVVQICEQNGVRWFEDKTNADPTLTLRNAVRSLLKTSDVPVALQKPRLLQLSKAKNKKIETAKFWADSLLKTGKVHLMPCTGELLVQIPKDPLVTGQFELGHHAVLLRNIIELVSPLEMIPLQDLGRLVKKIFDDGTSDPKQQEKLASAGVQVAGVHLHCQWTHSAKKVLIHRIHLARQVPTKKETTEKRLTIWSEHDTATFNSTRGVTWNLWDGRYWIAIRPPRSPLLAKIEVDVRFLEQEDLAPLRASLDEKERGLFEERLRLAKGPLRFTCPVLVTRDVILGSDAPGIIVALPSLGWSRSNWKREGAETPESDWVYDIRYKHARLEGAEIEIVESLTEAVKPPPKVPELVEEGLDLIASAKIPSVLAIKCGRLTLKPADFKFGKGTNKPATKHRKRARRDNKPMRARRQESAEEDLGRKYSEYI